MDHIRSYCPSDPLVHSLHKACILGLPILTGLNCVSDGLQSTAMVKIHVKDVNDNRPRFYPSQYNINLAPNSRAGSEVLVVKATDSDAGSYGEITYEIIQNGGQNGRNLFNIDGSTGELSVLYMANKTT